MTKEILKFVFFFKKIPLIVYKIAFALFATVLISNIKFDLLETYLFDLNTRTSSYLGLFKLKEPKIAIIQVSPNTLKKYGTYPTYDTHVKLLKKLSETKNSIIIYNYRKQDNQLANISGSYDEKFKFSEIVKQMGNVHFILPDMDLTGEGPKLKTKLGVPLNSLSLLSAPRTIDSKINSKGSVTRRIILDYQGQTLAHFYFAKQFNPELKSLEDVWGAFERIGTMQAYIRFHPNNSFPTNDIQDVLSDDYSISNLNNKLILIGDNTDSSVEDYADTPFAFDAPDLISTTELHANAFNTLIQNYAPKKTPSQINFIVTLLISIFTVYISLSVKPSKGIVLIVCTFFLFWGISVILLAFFDIWVDLAHPLLTIFLCYYFFIPYRLILENRRSWEYFQKNKLLQQVEELKTNFISMMSHDLKTPIARIQGMTEVILKDDVTLSPIQREAVDTIKGSSDDLLKFINSILQYGRIESQGVELHKQSKDINQVLTDVVKKHEFLAKVKKIKVHTELEPMFPIQIDVELMKQVLSNLVENAIKYSHEDSSVTVRSREEGSQVVIEVTDNGVGIPAEDLPNIFMKFYRSHNVKTSTIKGTGLGLYLAKYFAELHKGDITVTSEVGKGSTFKLTLPA
jgi:signal transduction histidine kinase